MLKTYSSSYIKIVLKLAAKVIALYMQAFIIQIKISNLKNYFLGNKVYLTMF